MSAESLYSRWLEPDDLVFDIGAHVGARTAVFLNMGCDVVAVEPQPDCFAQIDGRARVFPAAVGARSGRQTFYVCRDGKTWMSTLEPGYTEKIQAHGDHVYDETTVDVVTLDQLVAVFGLPAFCKIDVEGGEREVLAGLSHPLPALSFEVHDFDPGKADWCIERLAELGVYEYAYSRRESFQLEAWPTERIEMFGDVYATLKGR